MENNQTKEVLVLFTDAIKKSNSYTDEKFERINRLLFSVVVVLLVMVAGLVFVYIEFVYSGSKNDDYKYNLSQQVNNQEAEMKILKICLKSGMPWSKCL